MHFLWHTIHFILHAILNTNFVLLITLLLIYGHLRYLILLCYLC